MDRKMNQINKGIMLIWIKISSSYFSYLTNLIVCRGPWGPMERQSPPRYLSAKKIPKPYCSRTMAEIPKPYCSRTMAEPSDAPATKSWSRLAVPRAMETPAPPLRHCGSVAQLGTYTWPANYHCVASGLVVASSIVRRPILQSTVDVSVISDWKMPKRTSSQPATEQQQTDAFWFKTFEIVSWNLSLVD
jgi:hypothetical protein